MCRKEGERDMGLCTRDGVCNSNPAEWEWIRKACSKFNFEVLKIL